MAKLIFSCTFVCDAKDCKQPVACTGTGSAEQNNGVDENGEWAEEVEEIFTPVFFNPPLRLMDFPASCPAIVSQYLCESFALAYANPPAALNAARTALEALMNELKVKRFQVSKSTRRPISLHNRIKLLPDKFNEEKELLTAVKWLGNSGSHDGDRASTADVFVAYEMLEQALFGIYDDRSERLKKVAAKVNRRKGLAGVGVAGEKKKSKNPG
ncbi:DUF4145 domain-containing protein [Stenotrophomonas forensis]|uniref:DUF4145 domain-containing protein n=1 Tax=Stenotrophomonas forensis TaxID=2871169 RepID=UPI0039C6926F